MADSHPKNLDPRPKRRRDEDSPYEIYTAGINTAQREAVAGNESSRMRTMRG